MCGSFILTWVWVTRWSPPLAVCTCFVVSDRPIFRKCPSIRPRIRSLRISWPSFALRWTSPTCQGYASLNGLPYSLVWLRLNRASLTATLSVCHAALLQDLRDRNFGTEVRLLLPRADHLLCPASSLSRVYVRPLKLLFARQPRTYSRRHRSRCRVLSTAITVIYQVTCDQASLIFFVAAGRYAYLSAMIKNARDAWSQVTW